MHKTSAWPLALLYMGLVVYASLFPFDGWRDQGIVPWAFLTAALPRWWTWFDVQVNVVGYAPLGFLLALGGLRAGRTRWPLLLATLAGASVSFLMETLQAYLPRRVPSNVDFALNVAGTFLGAVLAGLLQRLGTIDRWSRFRAGWLSADARGAMVLLALWPLALLFPAAVPLGLGQVFERLETSLAEELAETPFLEWLPVRDVELQPLVPGAEMLCVLLGALIPCLIGYGVVTVVRRRAWFLLALTLVGVGATALSAALSYGPAHAWAWWSLPVRVGWTAAVLLSVLLLPVSARACAALALFALALHLSLLNQAPTSAYFAQTLQTWEQGRFIRFHGLAQWLGWVWPFAAGVYLVLRLSRSEAARRPRAS
ncbi:VanZ family protein [Pseudorhodoferax sp. Leaf267]|uniref:VanZ family protein n=1 Tax=Pseudorhodoferax sp. Leaf267 TaxID=1736316 RepID=UPI0006F8A5B8|nr:VanZ family protein [Pseudorhodoferax sp. Leaf267]KQP12814.1 teicoplanin resistance protein VanZ [Pseudorhodoferax sp. Leaf267]